MLKGEIHYCALEIESKQKDIYSVETRIWFGEWNKQDCICIISKGLTEREVLTKALDNK